MELGSSLSLCSLAGQLLSTSRSNNLLEPGKVQGTIAKWLRRQIRMKHLFLFEGAGSNPAGVDYFDELEEALM